VSKCALCGSPVTGPAVVLSITLEIPHRLGTEVEVLDGQVLLSLHVDDCAPDWPYEELTAEQRAELLAWVWRLAP
jgi:hypothetical protein